MKKALNILLLLALMLTLAPMAALAQDEVVCESDVIVQADDWLSKLADKFLGDLLAFPAIVEATNAKAATDDSYATIENADLIEVGWKLCVPSSADAQAMLGQAAAPAAASTAGEEQTLVVWDIEVGAYGEVFNQLNATFEAAHPGVKIERTTYTLDDIMNTLPLAMAQPDGPDIAQVNQGQTNMGRLVEAGLLLPLDDYASKYGWRQIFSEGLLARNSFTPDGKTFGEGNLWGISVSAEIVGVFYNKKIFADNGVEVPQTFDEFQAALKTFKDKGVVPLALGAAADGVPAIHDFSGVQHLLISRQYLDDFIYGRNNVSFDTPENREAASIVQEWANNGYFTPGFEGIAGADMAKLFATGQAAMMISGNWWSGDIIAATEPGTIGFFTLPPLEGKPAMAIGGLGVPFSINKNTKNPDLAAEYINWLVSRDSANQIAAVGQLTSAPLGAVEINPLLKDIATTFEQNNKNNTIGHYIDWAAPTLFDELGAASQELLAQRITPEEFTARIEKVYADFLATRK